MMLPYSVSITVRRRQLVPEAAQYARGSIRGRPTADGPRPAYRHEYRLLPALRRSG
jgi:hypothetical protein